jgi:hypothetical protein
MLRKICNPKGTVDEDSLRSAPPAEVVRLAKEHGFTTEEIVRTVSGCLTYREAQRVAREYAPLLGITVKEFLELGRNE